VEKKFDFSPFAGYYLNTQVSWVSALLSGEQ